MEIVSKEAIVEARRKLMSWQSLPSFKQTLQSVGEAISNKQLFKTAGLTFLREAMITYDLAEALNADALRLCEGEWPDSAIRCKDVETTYEIAEALEEGRKRGAEPWDDGILESDPVENWGKRAAGIPAALKAVADKKASKGYPPNSTNLIIYLNIDDGYGTRHKETVETFLASTENAAKVFQQVWILWKDTFYLVWDNGERSMTRIQLNRQYKL